jgi:Methyltransferase domain
VSVESFREWLLSPPLLWQMRFCERCALEGILAHVRPRISIEIGTAGGGSLYHVAAASQEVHSFDVDQGITQLARHFDNVRFHVGDSSELVPKTLRMLEEQQKQVDFALVDGDHSTEGVQRDAEALLDSAACARTVIVFHDAANDEVRAGLEAMRFHEHPRVTLALLDFVPGYLVESGIRRFQIWNGLAVVILDDENRGSALVDDEFFDVAALYRRVRDDLRAGNGVDPASELRACAQERDDLRRALEDVQQSLSWRITAPLRVAKRFVRRRSAAT